MLENTQIGRTTLPVVTVPRILKPDFSERIGGQWENCTSISNFSRIGTTRPAREKTEGWVGYDDGNMYFCFKLYDFALDPVSNQRHSFRADSTTNGASVNNDDSVEMRIVSPILPRKSFNLIINSNCAIASSANQSSGQAVQTLERWTPQPQTYAKICDGYWIVKIALPFSDLGIDKISNCFGSWRFQFLRHQQALPERSSWAPVRELVNDISGFGYALLTDDVSQIYLGDHSKANISSKNSLLIKSQAPFEGIFKSYYYQDKEGSRSVMTVKKISLRSEQCEFVTISDAKEEIGKFQYSLEDATNGRLIYQSPVITKSPLLTTHSPKMYLNCPASSVKQLYINGKQITNCGIEGFRLTDGNNTVVLKVACADISRISFRYADNEYKIGPGWYYAVDPCQEWRILKELSELDNLVQDTVYVKFVFMSQISKIFPNFLEDTLHLSAGNCYVFFVKHDGLARWDIDNKYYEYSLYVDLPPSVNLVGASSKAGSTLLEAAENWRDENLYKWTKLGFVDKEGKAYQRYHIAAKEPVNFSKDNEGLYNSCAIGVVWDGSASLCSDGKDCIYVHCECNGGSMVEVPLKIPLETVEIESVSKPEKLRVVIGGTSLHHTADQMLMKQALESVASVGCTDFMLAGNSEVCKSNALGQFFFLRYTHHPDNAVKAHDRIRIREDSNYFEFFPERCQLHQDGYEVPYSICPATVLTEPQAEQEFREAIRALADRMPNHTALFWDCEYVPYYLADQNRNRLSTMACFCEYSLETFASRYNIKDEIDVKTIGHKYLDQWIDFHTTEIANLMRIASEVAHEKGKDFITYSSYQSDISIKRYSFDYRKISPFVDWAMAGYGRSSKMISETKKALNGKPLILGLLSTNAYPSIPTCAEIVTAAFDSQGGVLLWWEDMFDARKLAEVSSSISFLRRFEDYVVSGIPSADEIFEKLVFQDRIIVRKLKGSYLVVFLGLSNEKTYFQLKWKGNFKFCSEVTYANSITMDLPFNVAVFPGQIRAFLIT